MEVKSLPNLIASSQPDSVYPLVQPTLDVLELKVLTACPTECVSPADQTLTALLEMHGTEMVERPLDKQFAILPLVSVLLPAQETTLPLLHFHALLQLPTVISVVYVSLVRMMLTVPPMMVLQEPLPEIPSAEATGFALIPSLAEPHLQLL